MGRFFSRKTEVLSHWIAFVDDYSPSPQDFYKQLDVEIKRRKVPSLEVGRIDYSEGGALSEKRVYLRFVRERLVFDVCACPFGTGMFFSCRGSEIPARLQFLPALALAALPFIQLYVLVRFTGLFLGPFLFLVGLATGLYVMRNAVALGLQDLDRALIRMPVLGPFYEVFLRRETYYRTDTRLMYLDLVPRIVKSLAEETVAANGLRLVREFSRAPILGELYRDLSTGAQKEVPPRLVPSLGI